MSLCCLTSYCRQETKTDSKQKTVQKTKEGNSITAERCVRFYSLKEIGKNIKTAGTSSNFTQKQDLEYIPLVRYLDKQSLQKVYLIL